MRKITLIALIALLAIGSAFSYQMTSLVSEGNHTKFKKKFKAHKELILQTGDIIFQSSRSGQSYAIQLATGSKYSHVGMIFIEDGEVMVYEAVQPVKLTPFEEFIKHGDGRHYVVKRLKDAEERLIDEVMTHMAELADSHLGKNYDIYFNWGDDRMYCSEVVWKIYNEVLDVEIGERKPLKDYDLSHPIVQQKMHERYGDNVPENEMMISPGAMFVSDLLETVVER